MCTCAALACSWSCEGCEGMLIRQALCEHSTRSRRTCYSVGDLGFPYRLTFGKQLIANNKCIEFMSIGSRYVITFGVESMLGLSF